MAWIKADAKAILAIHEHVITNNGRLSVTHNDYNTWTLNIKRYVGTLINGQVWGWEFKLSMIIILNKV